MSLQGIKNLGYQQAEDIIGKEVLVQETFFSKIMIPAVVIGVFADYKRTTFLSAAQESWRKGDRIGIALTYADYLLPAHVPRKISVRISPENFESGLAAIKEKYDKLFPGNAFNWYFLDQNINRYYVNEKIALNQIILFASLVVGIACLGLLGMITQKIIQKTKEIGVRKVLGARLHHIGSVLLVSTIRQIIIAVLIGVPLAWYLTQQYLERFSERIALPWWHYAVPVVLLLSIMFATIVSILIKAARTNPVESLRYE
jgi:putative ABC transport system permease protein